MDAQYQTMPMGWAETTLEAIVNILDSQRIPINNGEREKRLSNAKTLYPYYGATGQVGNIDDYIFEGDSVLLGEDAAPFLEFGKAKAYMATGRFWVNNHAHILRGIEGIDNKFLCNQLNIVNYRPFVSGTTRLKLTQGSMRDIPVKVAPLNEQKRIVDKIERLFSNLDEGEALLKQVQKQLTTYRQSVLKAAVTGELTKDWREANKDRLESGETLLQRILKSRREHWQGRGKYKEPVIKYSPGDHPGWIWGTLETFCDVKGGVTVDAKKQIVDPMEIPYLRVANVQDGYIDLSLVKTIKVDKSKIEELVLHKGDILFTEGGDIDKLGRGWVWEGQISICTHQNHIFRGRPFCEEIHPRFISYYCGSLGKEYFLNGGKQTTNLASISLTKLKAFPVVLPSVAEQAEIVSIINDISSRIDTLGTWCTAELTRSASLRQSILKDAFSGKLVPQDPADEPASELLKRIQAQKASMNNPRATKRKTKATT